MQEEYGADFITITDEDGKEYELEVLSVVEYEGSMYYALCSAEAAEGDTPEVDILKQVTEDGEDLLAVVDDEDELAAVYALMLDDLDEGEDEKTE